MKYAQSWLSINKGPADWLTGDVYIDPIRNADEKPVVGCAHVRFTHGARIPWHRHTQGQTLYVTDGVGLVCSRGGQPQEICLGDAIYVEPGEEHWHGANHTRIMAHGAIREADEAGVPVTWLEHVTIVEYGSQQ